MSRRSYDHTLNGFSLSGDSLMNAAEEAIERWLRVFSRLAYRFWGPVLSRLVERGSDRFLPVGFFGTSRRAASHTQKEHAMQVPGRSRMHNITDRDPILFW